MAALPLVSGQLQFREQQKRPRTVRQHRTEPRETAFREAIPVKAHATADAITAHLQAQADCPAQQMAAHLREHGWEVLDEDRDDRMLLLAAHLIAHQLDTSYPTHPDSCGCPRGPLCAYWHREHYSAEDPGGCIHDSCMALMHELCEACQQDANDGIVYCPRHGSTVITANLVYTGYAGGCCIAVELACGCTDVDESNDIRAAR